MNNNFRQIRNRSRNLNTKFWQTGTNTQPSTYRRGKSNDQMAMFTALLAEDAKQIEVVLDEGEALKNSVVFGCVNIIASDIAKLPLNVVNVKIDDEGNETHKVVRNHPISKLLRRRPNKHQNRADFMRQIVSNLVLHGCALVVIRRTGNADPIANIDELIPLDHGSWEPELLTNGEMKFHVKNAENGTDPYTFEDVLYFKTPVQTEPHKAHSPLACASRSIQIDNGYSKVQHTMTKRGRLNGVLFVDPMGDDETESAADIAWNKRFGPDGEGGTPVISAPNARYQDIDPKAADMELDAAKRTQVQEIARFFRVPVEKLLHGTKSYASATVVAQEYAREALVPHIDVIEAEMTRAFFGTDEEWIIDVDDKDLLRGSNIEQAEYLTKLLGAPGGRGGITQNELRYELGLPRSLDPEADKLSMGSTPNAIESEIEKEVQRRLEAIKKEQE